MRSLPGCGLAFGIPFISGKDSLHNQFTNSETGEVIRIPSTLLISAIGIVEDVRKCVTMDFKKPGNAVYLVQAGDPSDLKLLAQTHRVVADLIASGKIAAAHDVSDGGIAVAAAENVHRLRVGDPDQRKLGIRRTTRAISSGNKRRNRNRIFRLGNQNRNRDRGTCIQAFRGSDSDCRADQSMARHAGLVIPLLNANKPRPPQSLSGIQVSVTVIFLMLAGLCGRSLRSRGSTDDFIDDFQSAGCLPERGVLPVKMRGGVVHQEELRPGGIRVAACVPRTARRVRAFSC